MYSPQHLARNISPPVKLNHCVKLIYTHSKKKKKKSEEKSDEENKITAEFKIQSGNVKIRVDPEIIREKKQKTILSSHTHTLSLNDTSTQLKKIKFKLTLKSSERT